MSEKPKAWMPREQWEALVRGENCPLCAEYQSGEQVNAYGYTVADLGFSRLRLAMNQFVAGYCVLICKRHIQEPYHLTSAERSLFFDDMMRAAQAIEQVFKPVKMNFQLLGNLVPHLHAHIVPRYYGDPAPGRPIDLGLEVITLTPQEYKAQVRRLQEALAFPGVK
jgi:diadenosine tetraphosphate (Ap4A) HIT family hydrolase